MITIATPTNTKQANGLFSENTREINKQQIAASYHETIYMNKFIQNEKSTINLAIKLFDQNC